MKLLKGKRLEAVTALCLFRSVRVWCACCAARGPRWPPLRGSAAGARVGCTWVRERVSVDRRRGRIAAGRCHGGDTVGYSPRPDAVLGDRGVASHVGSPPSVGWRAGAPVRGGGADSETLCVPACACRNGAGAAQECSRRRMTKWFQSTRLETRTKESNMCASAWVE